MELNLAIGCPHEDLATVISLMCRRLWTLPQMSEQSAAGRRRQGDGEHAHVVCELIARTYDQQRCSQLGNYSRASLHDLKCTAFQAHCCSHCMAQLRALSFKQKGMDRSMECNTGPDPYGRPPLPRKRQGATSVQEIIIRPPLPRRRPCKIEQAEMKPPTDSTEDVERRQLAEAVDVIAKSTGRQAKTKGKW